MKPLADGTIHVNNVSKRYRLGTSASLRELLSSITGKQNKDAASRILWALKDVSFQIDPGESLGLIGPNGAGKTTALKLLSNISRPTKGTIVVAGRVSSLIELGAGFHPELSGRENIYLNGAILGLSRAEIRQKIDGIIAFAELERFIDTPIKRYSSGMYVRLGFAVAAHVEPRILLVDEVLAVGDASFRQKCIDRMDELRELGTTILFVSHNMHMVRRICDNGLLLMSGIVKYYGEIDDAIAKYERLMHERSMTDDGTERFESDQGLLIGTISVLDAAGAEQSVFQHGEQLTISIGYTAAHPILSPVIRLRIVSSDNKVVAMVASHHKLSDVPAGLTLSGSRKILLSITSLEMIGGHYSIEVRIMDTTDTTLLSAGHSNTFYVESPGFAYESDRGSYMPVVSWLFPEAE